MSLVYSSEVKPRTNKPSSLRPKFDNQYTEVYHFLYRVKTLNNVFIPTLHYESNCKSLFSALAPVYALGGWRLSGIWAGYSNMLCGKNNLFCPRQNKLVILS